MSTSLPNASQDRSVQSCLDRRPNQTVDSLSQHCQAAAVPRYARLEVPLTWSPRHLGYHADAPIFPLVWLRQRPGMPVTNGAGVILQAASRTLAESTRHAVPA